MDPSPSRRSTRRWLWLSAYLILLIASQVWIATHPSEAPSTPAGSERVTLPGPVSALSALHWKSLVTESAKPAASERLPVVLLHGSPGEAADLAQLAARLAADGREVLSIDLPGFGASVSVPGGRSILAHARVSLACVPWQQFHVAAWSMGGGVALHMAQLEPERVRSVTLIASIGVQEAEGSGNFFFEHVKYALMGVLVVPGFELVPHFGFLGDRASRLGFILNFWESDQRPLRSLLSALTTPLLIAHGRSDFLVPLWCAEESHALVRSSRLVVFEASHFLLFEPPFGQLDRLLPELQGFLGRHDAGDVPEQRTRIEFSSTIRNPRPEPYWLPRNVPWWMTFLAIAVFARWRALWCGLVIGGLCALLQLDLGLALCAALLGASWRALRTPQGSLKGWLSDLAKIMGACVAVSVFAVWASPRFCSLAGPWGGALITLALPILCAWAIERFVRERRKRTLPA